MPYSGYSEKTQFPRATDIIRSVSAGTTAVAIYGVGNAAKVGFFAIRGGAAAAVVVLRGIDDSPVYREIPVGIAEYVEVSGLVVDPTEGLEMVLESAGTDVVVFTHEIKG